MQGKSEQANDNYNVDILTCKHHFTWEQLVCTELYMQLEFQFFYQGDGIHKVYVKQRILFYHEQGRKTRRIRNLLLNDEGIRASDVAK